jgi:hypothetical protein
VPDATFEAAIVAGVGINLRHNYGVARTAPESGRAYVHRALDIFCPVGTAIQSPSAGAITSFAREDRSAGGFWLRYTQDNGVVWYVAHGQRPPFFAEGFHLGAGIPMGLTGCTGNCATRRTEAHAHVECYVPVGGALRYADPYAELCRIAGVDARRYSNDGIAIPGGARGLFQLATIDSAGPGRPARGGSGPAGVSADERLQTSTESLLFGDVAHDALGVWRGWLQDLHDTAGALVP